jgi:hypothetical protein
MTLRDLYNYCVEKANQYPEYQMQIHSFYDLAEMEVEDGSSEVHECELAYSDINQLIQE